LSLRHIGEPVGGLKYPAVSDAVQYSSIRLERDRAAEKVFKRHCKILILGRDSKRARSRFPSGWTLEFGQFEGAIPQGEYGAGRIKVWDHGTYELEERTNDRIAFVLRGFRLTGSYHLIRFKHGEPRDWLSIKRRERA
jgi:hypothetical protein